MKKRNKEELILELEQKGYFKEGGVYYGADFSEYIYKSTHVKSLIIKNGLKFHISPTKLLKGSSLCIENTLDINKYIINELKNKEFLNENGVYYGCDFSKFEYKGRYKKGIVLKNNIKFHISFASLLDGSKLCIANVIDKTDYFINELKNKGFLNEGGIYHDCDFSKFEYKGANNTVIIIDKNKIEHKMLASVLQNGNRFSIKSIVDKTTFTLNRMYKIHNNKYKYPNFVYNGVITKIIIECPIHGNYKQLLSQHLDGAGCNICNSSITFNKNQNAYFYIIELEKENGFKGIGFGISNVYKKRINEHIHTFKKTNTKATLIDVFHFNDGNEALILEKYFKTNFYTVNFGIDGFRTECLPFETKYFILEKINSISKPIKHELNSVLYNNIKV